MMSFALPYPQIKSLLLPLALFLGLPSTAISDFCEDFCQAYRKPNDSTEAYTLDCVGENDSEYGVGKCYSACKKCTSICHADEEGSDLIFQCPDISKPTPASPLIYIIIAVCVVVVLCVAGGIFALIYMRKRRRRVQAQQTRQSPGGMGYTPGYPVQQQPGGMGYAPGYPVQQQPGGMGYAPGYAYQVGGQVPVQQQPQFQPNYYSSSQQSLSTTFTGTSQSAY